MWVEYLKKYYLYVIISFLLIFSVILFFTKREVDNVDFDPLNVENVQEIKDEFIYIDIKGAVMNPDVYKVERGTRLFQLVSKAGGLMSDANQNAVNFSIILHDEDVIYIPNISEEYSDIFSDEKKEVTDEKININTATLEELQSITGVGPATAQAIVDYRDENGLFGTIEDIVNVPGIGDATFNEIKDTITT